MASRSVMISCRMESSFFLPGSSPVSLALRASWFRLIPILFSSYRMRFNSRGLAFTCFSISTALANEEKLISVISALSFSSISSSSVTYTFSNRSSFGRFLLSCFDVELAIGKPVQVFNLEHRRCEKIKLVLPNPKDLGPKPIACHQSLQREQMHIVKFIVSIIKPVIFSWPPGRIIIFTAALMQVFYPSANREESALSFQPYRSIDSKAKSVKGALSFRHSSCP